MSLYEFTSQGKKQMIDLTTRDEREQAILEKCASCGRRAHRFKNNVPYCRNCYSIKSTQRLHYTPRKNIASEQCLKCGAIMVKKYGKSGPFLGCSRYPACDGVLKG